MSESPEINLFSTLPLNECLIKALDKLGFTEPTPVQLQAIPLALEKKDLMVSAETGSGKSAAYLLPTLHHLLAQEAKKSGARALVLVPTRELVRQVLKQSKQLMGFTKLLVGGITGGDDFKFQKAFLRKNPEIIIATPGRLLEHMEHGSVDLADLEVLILDEADRMLDMGFCEDVLKIVAACNSNQQHQRQTHMFSATLDHHGLAGVAKQILNDPQVLQLSTGREQHSNIRHDMILADDEQHKIKLLNWLLDNETYKKALVFTNTRDQADRLCGKLQYLKKRVSVLHGEKNQAQRIHVVKQFQQGGINILVASDVAARGLDILGIDIVINFEMARKGDDYLHRSGRTGRAGEQGIAISLIDADEWNLMSSIERYLRIHFERRTIEGLEAEYKGPKKLKKSGKAAGTKKKKVEKKLSGDKRKKRERDKKKVGKRRTAITKSEAGTDSGTTNTSTNTTATAKNDGFGPLMKKKELKD